MKSAEMLVSYLQASRPCKGAASRILAPPVALPLHRDMSNGHEFLVNLKDMHPRIQGPL